jgi:hypothetical protein
MERSVRAPHNLNAFFAHFISLWSWYMSHDSSVTRVSKGWINAFWFLSGSGIFIFLITSLLSEGTEGTINLSRRTLLHVVSYKVQTGSGAHPASCSMGTWVTFPEEKRFCCSGPTESDTLRTVGTWSFCCGTCATNVSSLISATPWGIT